MVGVGESVELAAFDTGSGGGAGELLRLDALHGEFSFQTAADTPVFGSSCDAGQINQCDTLAIGFD